MLSELIYSPEFRAVTGYPEQVDGDLEGWGSSYVLDKDLDGG